MRPASRFRARVEPVPGGGHYVVVPEPVADAAGLRYRDRVRGTVDGVKYRSSLMKYGGVFHLGIHKATLEGAGKGTGQMVDVTIEIDREPLPGDTLPPELIEALAADDDLREAWDRLAPSRRREHVKHVTGAKTPETRRRRLEALLQALKGPR
jgi:bifunctional DNA-binding transcriptional regulator/antitoxin component of YhaV-PrlF toxin-antitoxin module